MRESFRASGVLALLLVFAAAFLASAARAAGSDALRIGLVRSARAAPMLIASERGFFRDERVGAELVVLPTSAEVTDALAKRRIDVGVVDLDLPFYRTAAHQGLRIIAPGEFVQAGFPVDAIVASRKAFDAGLKRSVDLRGRRIGIEAVGAPAQYGFAALARRYRFEVKELKFVPLKTVHVLADAVARGQVDAVLLPAAEARRLETSHKGAIVAWIGDQAPWQLSAVATTSAALRDKPAAVEAFARAYRGALEEYAQTFLQREDGGNVIKGPHYEEDLALIARKSGVAAAEFERAPTFYDVRGQLLPREVEAQVQFWQGQGLLPSTVVASELVDTRFGIAPPVVIGPPKLVR